MTLAPTSVQREPQHSRTRWIPPVLFVVLLGVAALVLLEHFDVVKHGSTGVIEGSGVRVSEIRRLPAFDTVELGGSNTVVIDAGAKQSVVVSGDDNLVRRVTTEVWSGRLVIANAAGSFSTRAPLTVHVTVPSLRAVALNGSGSIDLHGVDVPKLDLTLPGSGTLTADGAADRVDVVLAGSGTVHLGGLRAADVSAVVSGSGSIFVTATRSLEATVSGSGSVIYTGSPRHVTRHVTGSGAISGA